MEENNQKMEQAIERSAQIIEQKQEQNETEMRQCEKRLLVRNLKKFQRILGLYNE